MGASPLFVRIADVGPMASAFWRVALALPALWLWAHMETRAAGEPAGASFRFSAATVVAGLFFAGDLIFWHLSILNTTVANATFLATLAPVWIVLASGLVLGEPVSRAVMAGLALCLLGAAALFGTSWSFAPERLDGDLYGLVTSLFFGGYFLAIRFARRHAGPGRVTFLSSVVTAVPLLLLAILVGDKLLPASLGGFATLLALALVSHVGGQGLLAYALGHLPVGFSSLIIFVEAIGAAFLGWLVFAEALSLGQALGGALILAGIFVARPRRN